MGEDEGKKHVEHLPDGGRIERHPSGRVHVYDSEGRVVQNTLPAEVAREMGKTSAQKRMTNNARVEKMLREAGYDNETNPPPEHLLVLAELSVSNHSALRDLRKLLGLEPADNSEWPVTLEYGQRCPCCKNHFYGSTEQTDGVWRGIMAILERHNAIPNTIDAEYSDADDEGDSP